MTCIRSADYQPGGAQPLSCSDVPIPAPFKCLRADGSMAAYPVPRPLTKEEIQQLVQAFADAAENAIKAGAQLRHIMSCES